MRAICFFAAWVIPAVVFGYRWFHKYRADQHLLQQGYVRRNEIANQRIKKSKLIGAGAYAVVLFSLQLLTGNFYAAFRSGFAGLFVCMLCALFARIAYQQGVHIAISIMEYGQLDSAEVLENRDKAWRRKQVPLQPGDEHGTAEIEYAEQNGMADPDAMLPVEKGPRQ